MTEFWNQFICVGEIDFSYNMNLLSEGNISSSSVLTTRAAVNQYFSVADKSCPTYHLLLSQLQPEKSVTETLILAVTVDVSYQGKCRCSSYAEYSHTVSPNGPRHARKCWLQEIVRVEVQVGVSRFLAKQIQGPIFHFLLWGRWKSLEQITKKLVLLKCQETLVEI